MAKISTTSLMGESLTTEMKDHQKGERRRECEKVDDDGCVHITLRCLYGVSHMISPLSAGGPFDSSQAQSAVVLPAL
jgi:hypothetical protein